MVALDGADGLLIDSTGCAHLFGGEAEMLGDMQARFVRYGFTARIALAGTLGAAWGLARYGPEAAFESLPIEALRIDGEAARTLRRLGLKTVGQLITLPRASLARRFRGEAVPENVLIRLDQAMGVKSEPIVPLVPPPAFLARQAMMEPLISHEGLEAALAELIARILRDLESAGQGVTRIVLRLFKTDGARLSLPLGLAAPTRDARHLLKLFQPKLEQIDAGFGIDALTLEAREVAPLSARQYGFMEDTGTGPEALAHLSDRVSNRHDGGALNALTPVASHIPERAETAAPAGQRIEAGEQTRERPLLLFDRPEPARVIAAVPDGPPMRFTWRRVARRIVKAEGPERIAPEWWKPEDGPLRPRDYYVVEDDQGRRYWLYREGLYGEEGEAQPSWFVHGLFP
jgi:protein ImuB